MYFIPGGDYILVLVNIMLILLGDHTHPLLNKIWAFATTVTMKRLGSWNSLAIGFKCLDLSLCKLQAAVDTTRGANSCLYAQKDLLPL